MTRKPPKKEPKIGLRGQDAGPLPRDEAVQDVVAAVVPKPDAERGAVVKAYVVLAPDALAACGNSSSARAELHAEITKALQLHVKGLLAPYEYPKEIEFVDALPMTTTGKVQRRVLRLQEQARARGEGEPQA